MLNLRYLDPSDHCVQNVWVPYSAAARSGRSAVHYDTSVEGGGRSVSGPQETSQIATNK